MSDDSATLIGVITLCTGIVGYLMTRINSVQTSTGNAIRAVQDSNAAAIAEAQKEGSDARHSLANRVQVSIGSVENRIGLLEREAVRRPDMEAMERRITDALSDIKTSVRETNSTVRTVEKSVARLEAHAKPEAA